MLVRLLFCSVLACVSILSGSSFEDEVKSYAKGLDTHYNIDKNIILAYAKTESAFKPYVLAIKTKQPFFTSLIFATENIPHKKHGKYVSVFPETRELAEIAYELLQKYKNSAEVLDYDFGIMQLNTRTAQSLKIDEKEAYLNYRINMFFGAKVIRDCFDLFKNRTHQANIVECYNRGTNINHLDSSPREYLARFMRNYNSLAKTKR